MDEGSLYGVLQFPYVPWPGIGLKFAQSIFSYLRNIVNSQLNSFFYKKMVEQFRDILSTFPQGRDRNRKYVYSEPEILSELTQLYHFSKVSVRGSNNTDIYTNDVSRSQPLTHLLHFSPIFANRPTYLCGFPGDNPKNSQFRSAT